MHPIDQYDTLRRGREELLRRAEYERMVRKARVKQLMNSNVHKAANWLGMGLESWGKKLKKFGAFARRQTTPKTTTRVQSKLSPHH